MPVSDGERERFEAAMPAISRALAHWRRERDSAALERAFELLVELHGDRRLALVSLVESAGGR